MSGARYHVSCSALSLTPFSVALESVSASFDGWQIVSEGKHNLALIEEEFNDLSQSYDLDYTVHAPFGDINISSLNKAVRMASVTEIAGCMRVGAKLGIQKYVIHPGKLSVLSSIDRERAMLLSRESIRTLSSLADSLGVDMLVENMTGRFALAPARRELGMLIAGTRAGICLDVSHASLEGQLDAFTEDEETLGMIHLSDNDGLTDGHIRVGTGTLDWVKIRSLVGELNLPVIIEGLSLEDCREGRKFLEPPR